MPTKPKRTRKQKRQNQQGGSRRWLSLPEVTNPISMVQNVDIQYVFAHGLNQMDILTIVPENTYIYYLAQSGYIGSVRKGHKFASQHTYELYNHFFTAAEPKPLAPYPTAHVYVPGDILPMSHLYFMDSGSDSMYYSWPKGVYRKPFSPEMEDYFIPEDGLKTMLHLDDVDTMARLYPTVPRLELKTDEMARKASAPAHVRAKPRSDLYEELVGQRTIADRVYYLELLVDWYEGVTIKQLYNPEFWFNNMDDLRALQTQMMYNLPGNLLAPAYPEPQEELPLNDLLAVVPSDRPYRLVILNSCRSLYVLKQEQEVVRLAERLSSASKEEGAVCVTSETRAPVLNLSSLRQAYERLIALYPRLKPALDAGTTRLTDLWRLHHRFFAKERAGRRLTGRLLYNETATAEALSEAMGIVRKWTDEAAAEVARIPDEEVRTAIQNTIETLSAMVRPLLARVEREFGQMNRRKATETQYLTLATGMTKKAYRNTQRRTKRANATGNVA